MMALPPPEEVTTEKSNSNSKKSKDETTKVAAPVSAVTSMASGGTSALAAGGVYSNPEAVTVGQTGAGSFSYPIEIPQGRNGLQPNIALQYSSYNGNDWLGVGWDLGFGSISRSRRNGLDYTANNFMVNGSDLVTNTTWGANFYCVKIEGAFTKYYFNTASNTWLATAKDGTKYYYGQTAASRMANGTNTYSWQLDRVEDTNGNYMTISYTTVSNQIYPYQISYTGKTGGLSTNKIVEFGLETRADNIYSYKTKYLVTTTKRLKTISVKVDGNIAYQYDLEYEYAANNGSSRLINIRKIMPGAVAPFNNTNSLPPTNLTYWNGGNGTFGSSNTLTLNGSAGGAIVFGDINGDGMEDFIKAYSTGTNPTVTVYPYLANMSSSGVFSFIAQPAKTLEKCPTGAMSVKLGDISGDGKADIVSNGLSGAVHAYLSNGDGTFSSKYTTTGVNNTTSIFLADLNGDGKADLVKSYWTSVNTYLSNGNGYFGTQNGFSIPLSGLSVQNIKISLADVNGDGKADLYVNAFCQIMAPPYSNLNLLMFFPGNGNGTFLSSTNFGATTDYAVNYDSIADINGDGLCDLAYFDSNKNLYVYFSNGTNLTPASTNLIGNTVYSTFVDINDDGMADMINMDNSGNSYFYKSNGNGTFATPIPAGGLTSTLWFADINGDGRSDMIKIGTNTLSYSMANGENAADKIATIVNPLGGITDITYGNIRDIPNSKMPFSIHPVTLIEAYDGVSAVTGVTSYQYSGAQYDYNTRDFREFTYVIETKPCGKTVKTTYEQVDAYKKGRPLTIEETESGATTPFRTTTLTWAADTLSGTTAKFVKLTNERTDIYDTPAVFTNKAYTYDNTHGGVLTTVTSGSGGAENVTATNTYINKGTWIYRKASETLTGNSTGLARQTSYAYDSLGNMLTKTYYKNPGTSPVETYAYDTYGNVVTFTDPKNYTTTYTYDPTFDPTYTHVTGITYPMTEVGTRNVTHSVNMQYTLFGKLDQQTDENLKTTLYDYDNYGRHIQTDYPDDGQTKYEYNDTATPVFVKTRVKETDAGYVDSYVDTWEYVDGFGRAIMGVSKGIGTNNYVATRQYYDNAGRNWKTEGPYFATSVSYSELPPATAHPTVEKVYDCKGRVVAVKTPKYNGSLTQFDTTNITYNGFTTEISRTDTVQTPNRTITRKEITDYLGRIVQVQEETNGVMTNYAYNAAGDLTSVTDIAGNVTNLYYNTLGQKTSMSDPDMGSWSYTYDLNGNLYQQTDAKSQTITFTYDELNRIKQKSYSTPDERTVYYSYDNLSITNGRGRLDFVKKAYNLNDPNPDDITTYNSYDEMGRPLSVTKTISGDQARTTSYTYDLSGKQKTITYPDSNNYVVTNNYYANTNLLNTVTGSDGVTYASINEYSPSGKIKILTHSNNTATNYTYDPRTEKLSDVLTTRANGSEVIQLKHYNYTAIGEIRSINDIHNSNVTYNYTYDNLSRLTNETGGATTESYTYYPIGNIQTKTIGANTFTYSYDINIHKHAVSKITFGGSDYLFSYDLNGNMTDGYDFTNPVSPKTRHIVYNADNMPKQIVYNGNITTDILYDGISQRVKKTVSSGSTTYYIGDHFEIRGSDTYKYIFAGNLRVAQVKGTTLSFFHKDHLGSSSVITSGSGTELESTEFTPFGSQRSHSGTNTSDYRYTDQELDAENGLYNYNARLYDPFIGRFISPDTIVPEPFNPQSLNRYSYVLNNPLIYTDPSGNFENYCNDPRVPCDEYDLPGINATSSRFPPMPPGALDYFYAPPMPILDIPSPWQLGYGGGGEEKKDKKKEENCNAFYKKFGAILKKGNIDIKCNASEAKNLGWVKFSKYLLSNNIWNYKYNPSLKDMDNIEEFGNAHFGIVAAARGMSLTLTLYGGAAAHQIWQTGGNKTDFLAANYLFYNYISDPENITNSQRAQQWTQFSHDLTSNGFSWGEGSGDASEVMSGWDIYYDCFN
jgi:RHS repeat-associated protein